MSDDPSSPSPDPSPARSGTPSRAARLPSRVEVVFYAVVRAILAGFSRLFWRLTVEGREHLPADGPFILSPVHRSNIDTPLAACVTTRKMRFMGKKEMWKIAPLGRVFTALGAFPVARGTADREALRTCIDVLKTGQPLVLFPEGTRRSGPVVEDLFDGAAYVAVKAGVPIVPVGIGGSEGAMPKGAKFIKPVKVHMIIGEPIAPPMGEGGRLSRTAVRDLTATLRDDLQRLYDEAQRRAGV